MNYLIFTFFVLILFSNFLFAFDYIEQDTLKICAIRVEFVEDDNELTSGNGKFMIDTLTTDPYAIDPAPHNRLYFQDQLKAAANYYDKVSNGRVIIQGDVFPLTENGAYELPQEMGFYNPNTTDQEINLGLSQLFKDAIEAGDKDETIHFEQYDLIVIFHAGVGRDIALDFDPTPQDISSLFITHKFLKESFGNEFAGIPVDEGFITQGILLPETENQEGEKIALTGILVSNIGSYLGLYDLFSPSRQRTGIGRFGLMDAGLLNLNGLVPSPPGAFSRKLLGWDEPHIITLPQNGIEVARLGLNLADKPTLIQIPINDDEYYLIEFRGDAGIKIDSLFFELLEGGEEIPSYLEVLKRYFADQIEIGESGVLLSVPDYDWGLPGAGILIWHVDERVIAEKGQSNRINDDPQYRAVDIEEADGSQDIGQIYSLLEAGYQTELGWLADFWFSNRPDYLKDFELYQNEFSTNTAPNTRANLNGAITHITLKNFNPNTSTIMTFDFSRQVYESRFPVKIFDDAAQIMFTLAGSVEGKGNDYFFILNEYGEIFAIGDSAGSSTGLVQTNEYKLAQITDATKASSLVLVDSDAIPGNDLLIAAANKKLYGLNLKNLQANADWSFETDLANEISGPMVTTNDFIYVPAQNEFYIVNLKGKIEETIPTRVEIADLVIQNNGTIPLSGEPTVYSALAPLEEAGQFNLISYNANLGSFTIHHPQGNNLKTFVPEKRPKGQFALADLDGNATYDIIFNAAEGIFAYNQQGFPISGFPIKPDFSISDSLLGTPLISDVDRDGKIDFIVASAAGQILTISSAGRPISEYQLSTGGQINFSPLIMQLDNDPELELLVCTNHGSVYAWQLQALEGAPTNVWLQANYNSANQVLIENFTAYKPISESLMPSNRVYNYPNPNEGDQTKIRYYLNEQAKVKIRIFDTAGALVDEFDGPGEAKVDNEIPWNVNSIASGIYLCQIEAKSESGSDSKIIKIMVVH